MNWDVLVVSSDIQARRDLTRILQEQGCDPLCASNVREAVEFFKRGTIALVFCDRELSDGTYREFLSSLRSFKTRIRVVLASRLADWDEYLEAMRLGAFDVIAAPCRPTDVEWMLIQAARELRGTVRSPRVNEPSQRTATAD